MLRIELGTLHIWHILVTVDIIPIVSFILMRQACLFVLVQSLLSFVLFPFVYFCFCFHSIKFLEYLPKISSRYVMGSVWHPHMKIYSELTFSVPVSSRFPNTIYFYLGATFRCTQDLYLTLYSVMNFFRLRIIWVLRIKLKSAA